jgi:uncharacterized membrane protein
LEEQDVPIGTDNGAGGWFSRLFENAWDWLPTLLAFLVVYALLFIFFGRDLFTLTTTAGGDTGAHHYPAQYLIEELLPNGRLTGWAPGWYAGMPMLTFYFPFPFLIIALLDYLLPYTVAFKFGTVLGVFLLPLTVYSLGRLWRIRRPFPVVAAVLAAAFLLMESTGGGENYSIYGGNILSTLAGEFGFMLSFALVFLFLGTAQRGMEKPRFNMLFVLNCLILMALVLSHIVTTIVLVCAAPGLILACLPFFRSGGLRATLRSVGYLLAVGAVGFCLTAFWSLPFVADMKWTGFMEWTQKPWDYLLPLTWQFITISVLGLIGMAFAVARKEWRLLPLVWWTVIVFVLYVAMPSGRLWNGRLLGFWYIAWYLWAAYAVAWFVRLFSVMLWDLVRCRTSISRRLYRPVVAIMVILVVGLTSHVAGGWIRWNYSGYEKKPAWTEYRQILDSIDEIGRSEPHARVMIEHGDKIDQFGTPRAFEIIPYWTGADTMEGTLMEASFTAAFHFINQRELSEQASNAIIGVDYPPDIDVTRGISHLQLMNIPYFLAFYNEGTTERVIPAVDADPRAELLETFGDYRLYHITGCSGYVEVMKNEPVRVKVQDTRKWRDMAVEWYKNSAALDTPLVRDNGEKALQRFASVTPEQAVNPPEVPIDTQGEVSNAKLENESLSFDTTAIGQPHWVKISYFPNWHVKGAEGPFLASPSMMMVIPTQEHVVLYYGRTTANTVGQTLEIIAWVFLLGLTVWRSVLRSRRRSEPALVPPPLESAPPRLPEPVRGAGDGYGGAGDGYGGAQGGEAGSAIGFDAEDLSAWEETGFDLDEPDDREVPDLYEDFPRP